MRNWLTSVNEGIRRAKETPKTIGMVVCYSYRDFPEAALAVCKAGGQGIRYNKLVFDNGSQIRLMSASFPREAVGMHLDWVAIDDPRVDRQQMVQRLWPSVRPEKQGMSWYSDLGRYTAIASRFDPSVTLTTKDSWFWKVLATLLTIVTFGRMSRQRFLTDFATTIGPVIAIPREWELVPTELLVHEIKGHVHDQRMLGMGISPWLGLPLYALLYLLCFFPLGLAFARYRFELRADYQAWVWMLQNRVPEKDVRARAASFGRTVGSAAYGWAWPRCEQRFVEAADYLISVHRACQSLGCRP